MLDPSRIHIQICHGDALLAAGLKTILRADPELDIVEGGLDAARPAAADGGSLPQVIIADYDVGLAVASRFKRRADSQPVAPKVLVFTSRCSEVDVRGALRAGVLGYLVQGCSTEETIQAARCVYRGVRYFCPMASGRMADSLTHTALTGREMDVLDLLADGLSNKLIARQLGLSVGTVKSHVGAILGKFAASSRTHAVIVAASRGLVQRGFPGASAVLTHRSRGMQGSPDRPPRDSERTELDPVPRSNGSAAFSGVTRPRAQCNA